MSGTIHTSALDELVELRLEKVAGNKDPNLPYIGLEQIAQGQPRMLGTLPSSSSVSINGQFSKDDILFGKLRPNLRKSLKVNFAGYCSTDILVLRSRIGVRPDFAGHVLQWEQVFSAAASTASGTKMPRASWNELKRFKVFKPSSENEQSHIASVLDTVDEAIAKTEAVIAKLRQVRIGLLHDLLTCGLDEYGQLRDPVAHPEQFQDSTLGRIPRNWEIKKLAVACSLIKDGAHIPPKRVETGPFLLGVQNMIDDQLSLTDADTRVPWDFFYGMHRTWQIKPGDVLFAIVGATIGKVARVPINFEPFTLQRSVAILRGTKDLLENDYLEIFLRGSYFQSLVKNSSNATAQAGLYLGQIACLDIPLPKVEEQQLISKKIQDLGQEIRQESACLTKLVALKSGLMDDLLTGRVRVPENVEVKQ